MPVRDRAGLLAHLRRRELLLLPAGCAAVTASYSERLELSSCLAASVFGFGLRFRPEASMLALRVLHRVVRDLLALTCRRARRRG
jgi:hypothetical protein